MDFEKVTVVPARSPTPASVRRALPAAARVTRWIAPDGWSLRRFDWPNPAGRGRFLFQAGRGDIFEKYLESIAHLHAQGWSVTSFDWRGQGGSGRLSADPLVGHAPDFGVYDSDLAAFWTAWRAEGAGPHVILGHSMGGMMVMRALATGTIDPDAAILVAPMLGLKSPLGAGLGLRIARAIANRAPTRAAWRGNERPATLASRQQLLTHDAARYGDEHWWYAATPALRTGPPSWTWLAEAFAGAASLATDPRIDRIATPVLTLVADRDRLVDARAAVRLTQRLPDSTLVRFGDESAHEILRETDSVRDRALAAIDSFLAAKAPA